MNTITSLEWRYAVKKFDSTKILSKTKIDILKKAFKLTASSYGLQPVKMIIIKDKKLQKKLVEHSYNQQQIFQASHVLVLCIPQKYGVEDVYRYFSLVKEIRNTPDDILNPFKENLVKNINKKTEEELCVLNKNQAYIALGNLLTVCAIEKIDACPMEGFISKEYDRILDLKKHNLTSVLILPIGFRAKDDYMKDLKKVRKQISEVVIEL